MGMIWGSILKLYIFAFFFLGDKAQVDAVFCTYNIESPLEGMHIQYDGILLRYLSCFGVEEWP
jgi:hypothetical protein